jgi:3-deoxy-manno-octulosonate cytidylyltransferase (CMP-KDO synthetase)
VHEATVLGVIPARWGSERLPGKPLREIAGRSLIEWVWRRAAGLEVLDACVIATDTERVAEACRSFGARVVLTSPAHLSGTDRTAEVAARPEFAAYDVIVNVQGDEPLVTEEQVRSAVEQVRQGWDVGTVAAPVGSVAEWLDPSVVKVTRRQDGAALYFSRAPIPRPRDGLPNDGALAAGPFLRHVGVYAFGRAALARWVRLPPGALESVERLEQLRALEAGLTMGVGLVAAAERGVDTPADLERVERRLRETEQREPLTSKER